ncbi:MAG: lactate racemase domain-containing protein [Actinomycetota bacterium]
MEQQIVFGDRFVTATLPDHTTVVSSGIALPIEPVADLGAEIRSALESPLDTRPLREIARGKRRVTIAFDDPTVPCYVPMWEPALTAILGELEAGGVRRDDVTLVCANALHRQFTHDELAKLIGADLVREFAPRLVCHDAEDRDGIERLGVTPSGYDVEISRRFTDADLSVYLNCSTTRGFSGGWKSICVGLSTFRSIRHHHNPDDMSMSFDRNRMHAMLDEMGVLVTERLGADRIFKVETVLANPLQVARIFGGSVGAARAAVLELNRAHQPARRDLIERKADIVIYGIPDWSPYAAYSVMNPLLTLVSTGLGYLGGMIEALGAPGCTTILATPCPDRWDDRAHGPHHEVWDRVLPQTRDPYAAREAYEAEYASHAGFIHRYRREFSFHPVHAIMALFPLKRLRHTSRVIVAGAEKPELVHRVGFESAATVEEAVARALEIHGSDAEIAFVPYPPAFSRF